MNHFRVNFLLMYKNVTKYGFSATALIDPCAYLTIVIVYNNNSIPIIIVDVIVIVVRCCCYMERMRLRQLSKKKLKAFDYYYKAAAVGLEE